MWCASFANTRSRLSDRDVVPMIVMPFSLYASLVRTERTPPAAPVTSNTVFSADRLRVVPGGRTELPGCDGGQGKGGLGEVQRPRHRAHDSLVDWVPFAVAARSRYVARIQDSITRLEKRGQVAGRLDDAHCIPAKNARGVTGYVAMGADLGVNVVHRNALYFDKTVVVAQLGHSDLTVLQGIAVVSRKILVKADGFHGCAR